MHNHVSYTGFDTTTWTLKNHAQIGIVSWAQAIQKSAAYCTAEHNFTPVS